MGTTAQTTRKTSRAKKITVDQAEKDKQVAIDRALEEEREKARLERLKASAGVPDEDDIAEYEEENQFTPSFGTSHGAYHDGYDSEAEDYFDIFEFGQNLEETGRAVEYLVKRNNEIVGELPTAVRWSELAKKYDGGGKYQIILRDANTKEYIKSQTQRLAEPVRASVSERETYIPPQPQMPQMDLNSTFQGMTNMFMQMQEMVQREKARNEREEKKSSSESNTLLMTIMQNQSQSQQQMMMEIAKMQNENTRHQTETFNRLVEKMDQKTEKMFSELTKGLQKKDEFGLKEMLALIESSRKSGMDTMKTVMDLSEQFSAMMSEKGGERDEPESKDSLLSKLVTGFMPLLTKANQQAQQMPGVAPQQVHPMQQIPQPRRDLRAPVPPPSQPPAAQFRNPQGPGPGRGPQAPRASQTPQAFAPDRRPIPSAASLGFATFADKSQRKPSTGAGAEAAQVLPKTFESSEDFIKRVEAEISESAAPVPTLTQTKGVHKMSDEEKKELEQLKAVMPLIRSSEIYEKASSAQKTIVELAFPLIAIYINREGVTPEIVANFVIDECRPQGFGPKVLEKEFTFDFLLQIASNFGIGTEKREWFGEFYETIKDAARNDAQGDEEHTLG